MRSSDFIFDDQQLDFPLFHGTAAEFLPRIKTQGLKLGSADLIYLTDSFKIAATYAVLKTNELLLGNDNMFDLEFRRNLKVIIAEIDPKNIILDKVKVGNNWYFLSKNVPARNIKNIHILDYLTARELT